MYELMAIEMRLKPRKFNHIPLLRGLAAQALFYATLHRIHPMVSGTIHDLYKLHPRMPKPFTMSSLVGAVEVDDLIQLSPSEVIQRLTTLHPHLTSIVQNGMLPLWLREGDQYLTVLKITQHARLYYRGLLHQASKRSEISFVFTSPTSFKKQRAIIMPRQILNCIFMSLFNHWNAFASEQLPDDVCEIIMKRICIVEVEASQDTLSFARGAKGIISGFSGAIRLLLDELSGSLRKMINTLAYFAWLSVVGVKTTVGMGQVRAI